MKCVWPIACWAEKIYHLLGEQESSQCQWANERCRAYLPNSSWVPTCELNWCIVVHCTAPWHPNESSSLNKHTKLDSFLRTSRGKLGQHLIFTILHFYLSLKMNHIGFLTDLIGLSLSKLGSCLGPQGQMKLYLNLLKISFYSLIWPTYVLANPIWPAPHWFVQANGRVILSPHTQNRIRLKPKGHTEMKTAQMSSIEPCMLK